MSQDQREERTLPSRTIAEAIRSQIESGELPPGAQLPSERDLASAYGTARNTAAKQRLRILSDAGLVITDQGKGSFVRPQMSLIRLGNDRYSPRHRDTGLSPFLLECAKQGKTGRFEVLSIDRVQPPAEVAERLGVSPKTKSVLRRENVFYADDDPVEQVTTYIPWTIAKGTGLLQDEVPHQFGIHGILEEQHHVMTRIREEVSTRMPRPEESRLLAAAAGRARAGCLAHQHRPGRRAVRADPVRDARGHDRPAVRRARRIAVTRSALPRIALLALIWGSAFLWIKLADRGFSPVEVTLARLALGAAVLFAIVLARREAVPRCVAAVGAHRGGGAVRQRGAVPVVRGGRADGELIDGRDHQRDHAAVDGGPGPGRPAPEGADELAGGRADRRVCRGGADLLALAYSGRADLGRWPGMPGRVGQLRGQLHLHGPVPGPPGI